MNFNIFYSWQSDLPNSTNRGFIETALEGAVKLIRHGDSIQVEPVIDRDTRGVPGSPDIAETIFNKISESQIFVCDVSIINYHKETHRPTPNPNVLIELGFAFKALGSQRIIMVMNTAFGTPEMLPFDLRMKRIMTYHISEEQEEKAEERRRFSLNLVSAIRSILEFKPEESAVSAQIQKNFKKVEGKMPELIMEMKADLLSEGLEFVRTFYLVHKNWVMNYGSEKVFIYYYEEHDNLDGKVQVLENYGFVFDVSTGRAKVYRMTEEFVELLVGDTDAETSSES